MVFLSISGKPVFDKAGKFHGYRGTGTDITERKKAEAALRLAHDELGLRVEERTVELRHSNTRLIDAIECISEGFILFDASERLVICNRKYQELFSEIKDVLVPGTSLEDLLRAAAEHGQRPEARGNVEGWVQKRLCQYRTPKGTLERRLVDGRWMLTSERRTHEGGIIGIRTDITERKRVEQELRESEERFKSIIDNFPAAIFLKDMESRFLLVNRCFEEWYGYSVSASIGKSSYDLFPKHLAESDIALEREVILSGQARESEFEFPFSDGSICAVSTTKFPVRGPEGVVIGIGTINTDITERKRVQESIKQRNAALEIEVTERRHAEVALQKSEHELQQLLFESVQSRLAYEAQSVNLATRIDELSTAYQQLAYAKLAQSQFLANMSHELRTPLNAIIGFSEIIRDEKFGPVGCVNYRDYAKDINDSGQHLLGLINDILDLSKIESGKDTIHDDDIEVPEILRSAMRLVGQRAEERGIKLVLVIPDQLPALRADKQKLKQILVNLLSNAIKFTDTGGEVTLKVWCQMDSGNVFQIVDTGIGIAPEDIPTALARFGQVDCDLNRKYYGTGLGLPLTKALVELHGGEFDLQSEAGVGTTVTVRFPAERIVESPDNVVSLSVEDGAGARQHNLS